MNTELFMSSFLSLERVQARTTLSRSTVYRKIAEGTFPRQILIGSRRVAWSEKAIEDWMTEQQVKAILRRVNLTEDDDEV